MEEWYDYSIHFVWHRFDSWLTKLWRKVSTNTVFDVMKHNLTCYLHVVTFDLHNESFYSFFVCWKGNVINYFSFIYIIYYVRDSDFTSTSKEENWELKQMATTMIRWYDFFRTWSVGPGTSCEHPFLAANPSTLGWPHFFSMLTLSVSKNII